MPKMSFEKLSLELTQQLPPRVRDAVVGRFGLDSNPPLTLEAVGRQHDITRERVRQIIEEGLRQLKERITQAKNQERYAAIFARIQETLRKQGSMKREDLLLKLLEVKEDASHAIFLLTLGDQFYNQRQTQDFHAFWTLRKDMIKKAHPLHQRLLSFFQKKKIPVSEHELRIFAGKEVILYLEVSKAIQQSPEGRWGLKAWPEVNPRGMRDKAYLALKQHGHPLHFIEVVSLIGKLQENFVLERRKPVLSQTVHNELIKDPRFVLIGRGTYGLSEWDLVPGTVKDVMRLILRNNGKTMQKAKLIEETLEQRQVKESTIMLNLQDRQTFVQNQDGSYTLRT